MSTPASNCWRTMSPTARRTRASNTAASGMRPESSASSVVVRSWARGRLPVCVVKMRSVLSFIVVSLLEPSHDLLGEVLDHAILTVQRRVEHDLPEPLLPGCLEAMLAHLEADAMGLAVQGVRDVLAAEEPAYDLDVLAKRSQSHGP